MEMSPHNWTPMRDFWPSISSISSSKRWIWEHRWCFTPSVELQRSIKYQYQGIFKLFWWPNTFLRRLLLFFSVCRLTKCHNDPLMKLFILHPASAPRQPEQFDSSPSPCKAIIPYIHWRNVNQSVCIVWLHFFVCIFSFILLIWLVLPTRTVLRTDWKDKKRKESVRKQQQKKYCTTVDLRFDNQVEPIFSSSHILEPMSYNSEADMFVLTTV